MGRAGVPWPLESYYDMTDHDLDKWEDAVGGVNDEVEKRIHALLQKKR